MERRVIVAFGVAPAILPFTAVAWALASGVHVRESFVIGSIYGAFTYGAALLLGVPLFVTLSGQGWNRWWQYVVAGATTGVCVWLAIWATTQKIGFDPRTVLVFVAAGVISAMGFWLVAFCGSDR